MIKYYYFYGSQVVEIKRSKIPDTIYQKGIKLKVKSVKTKLKIDNISTRLNILPSKYKAVILNV